MTVSKQQYESALSRIEVLLPVVDDNIPTTDNRVVELIEASDMVETYEKTHYPIGKISHYPKGDNLFLQQKVFFHLPPATQEAFLADIFQYMCLLARWQDGW